MAEKNGSDAQDGTIWHPERFTMVRTFPYIVHLV